MPVCPTSYTLLLLSSFLSSDLIRSRPQIHLWRASYGPGVVSGPPSPMKKLAQRGGVTYLGSHSQLRPGARDRKRKQMIRKGLRSRKEVGVIVKVGGWPLFLIPVQPECQDPRETQAKGIQAGTRTAARITQIPLQQTELRPPANPRLQPQEERGQATFQGHTAASGRTGPRWVRLQGRSSSGTQREQSH